MFEAGFVETYRKITASRDKSKKYVGYVKVFKFKTLRMHPPQAENLNSFYSPYLKKMDCHSQNVIFRDFSKGPMGPSINQVDA